MFRLRTKTDFDAAHWLEDYEGKCARLHGHLWVVEAFVTGEELDEIGFVMDFGVIKDALKEIINDLDHYCLNDEVPDIGNPTCENVAKYIYNRLKPAIPEAGQLEKIRVWESPRSWCEYFE